MASKDQFTQIKNRLFASALLCIVLCVFAFPTQAYAKDNAFPTLTEFVETVKDGHANTLRGIYISNVIALPIMQQPYGNPGFVSNTDSVLTQFSMASEVGNLGLLAHNHLAGKSFSDIKPNDQIVLIYGDGHTESFLVDNTMQYQALSPLSPYSQFKDLETESILSAEDLFREVYRGEYHLTLQTCIDNEGNASWGRLFIIAKPVGSKSFNGLEEKTLGSVSSVISQ
ncbi:MAG: hypothetical protein H7Y59_10030 [Anaerolineales bacterium]|nr:hypothetical protein [Anaerolineales bacterium]